MRGMLSEERGEEPIEVLKLCDEPGEVLKKLREMIVKQVQATASRFPLSIEVKVYKPPKNVNKMVFRAIADEYVKGATLREIWRFVHKYYQRASRFNSSLSYKGWETYVSREVFKMVKMGYASTNNVDALQEIIRVRKKVKRFMELWSKWADEITVKPVPTTIRRLPSRPSRKRLDVEIRDGEVLVRGLCGTELKLNI
ncbi:MAG: hypothetical protein N3F04_06840 [Candidatus Nezhaarchaeota archaeon]|nr:hypothetical protein [Candidatus Nezhaarchaeota archaeon]